MRCSGRLAATSGELLSGRLLLPARWLPIILLATLCHAAPTADLVISPTGADTADGSADRPLRTPQRARDLLRPKLAAANRDLAILLRGGTYYLDEPLTLGPDDSGHGEHRVIWAAWPGERPVLVGGRRLTGWKKVGDGLYSVATDPAWEFHQLFENGQRVKNALHPNDGYLIVESGVVLKDAEGQPRKDGLGRTMHSNTQFHYGEADLPGAWQDLRGASVFVWASYDWFTSQQPIQQADRDERLITLQAGTLNPIVTRGQRRYRLLNVRGALDSPGEFWRDPESGEVLYQPLHEPFEQQVIVAPTVSRVIELKGAGIDQPVRNISFRGIDVAISKFSETFVETRGTHGNGPWNEPMNKEAMVYLEHAQNCSIEDAELANAGYSGVAVVWSGRGNRIANCEIRDAGFHGVLLSGYRAEFGPAMDLNRDNVVEDNWIHHCGRLVGHGGGLFIHSSGHNRIVHNQVHNMPRYGLCIKGQHFLRKTPTVTIKSQDPAHPDATWTMTEKNQWDFVHSGWNEIVANDFYLCNEDSEDSGFISTWGPGRDNVIADNVIHDSYRTLSGLGQAIYLDDESHWFTVRNNLIRDFWGGSSMRLVFVKGTNHLIENNLIIGDKPDTIGLYTMSFRGSKVEGTTYRRNVVALRQGGEPLVFGVNAPADGVTWQPGVLAACDQNLLWDATGLVRIVVNNRELTFAEWQAEHGGRYGQQSIVADPLLTAEDALQAGSPALKLGFEPLHPEQAGLTNAFPERFRAAAEAAKAIPPESLALATRGLPKRDFADDFEGHKLGSLPDLPDIEVHRDGGAQIDVVAESPYAGQQCLKLTDHPDSQYDPRLLRNLDVRRGRYTLRFAIKLDAAQPAAFSVHLRDYANKGGREFSTGVALEFGQDGSVAFNGRDVAKLPPGTWAAVVVTVDLGTAEASLALTPARGPKTELTAPFVHPEFARVTRLVMYGAPRAAGALYLDDLGWKW